MTAILHISDPHIMPDGSRMSARLDSARALTSPITRTGSIRDQIGPIDAVLVSGDLSDDGPLSREYRVGDITLIGLDTLIEAQGLRPLVHDSLLF